jgi:AcrR family transcriptional regulator
MSSTRQQRRSDTRQRIQDVALELFASQGYEKTSLREIAERLQVTKAALYYHFKTKEDILVSLFSDRIVAMDELLDWGRRQSPGLETSTELLRRYSEALEGAGPLFRFLHDNQAAVRELRVGEYLRERGIALIDLITPKDSTVIDRIRCMSALLTLNGRMIALYHLQGDPEEQRLAALTVATGLVTEAHGHSDPAAEL